MFSDKKNAAETPVAAASAFSFMNSGTEVKKIASPKQSFDPLLSMGTSQQPMMTPQMAMVMQQQQQQILMMQAQMQQMQMGNGNNGQRFAMPQQRQGSTGNPNVMGGMGGSGVSTSFAFFEDPNTARKEASNKKFDFVLDAMKSAK